ncbi:MAG: tig, trigger factor, trigger factor [Candidatus Berkelbacteria bacterium]|nr:tig, trigger factor, trigger factor [Candidatus Berkelbacteria bacterium]
MEIKKEVLPKSKVKLVIKVSSAEMRGFFARVYNKLAPQITVKGFRPGMAPKSMTVGAIGESRLQSEIMDLALQETYTQALQKENLIPIAPPKINIKLLKDLTVDTAELEYEAEIDLLPDIKLGDYKKIKISAEGRSSSGQEVNNDEIDQVLSHLGRSRAQFKDKTEPAKEGDRVEMNFEGFDKGVQLENFTSKNYPVILGSKTLIPEFEAKLIGLKKGDKKEFKVDVLLPNEKTKKLIEFKVEILQVQEVILPKMDDSFAKTYQKDTLDDLKKAVKEDIIKQKQTQDQRNLENEILEELLKITQVEISDSLINQEVDRQIHDIGHRLEPMGMTFEKYLESLKKTEEEFRKSLKSQAEKTIKIGLALGEIVKQEKIDSKDKEAGHKALEKLISYATK